MYNKGQRPSTEYELHFSFIVGMGPQGDDTVRVLLFVQESNGDLIRDYYLSSPPIEPSLTEFLHQGARTGNRTRVAELSGKDEYTELSGNPRTGLVLVSQRRGEKPRRVR